jgi:hypothetical protein
MTPEENFFNFAREMMLFANAVDSLKTMPSDEITHAIDIVSVFFKDEAERLVLELVKQREM